MVIAVGSPARRQRSWPAPAVGDQARKRLYGAIRAACGRLGIDDDERKDLIHDRFGVRSMTDMSVGQLGALLDHLNKGWKGPMAHRAHLGKIKALWWSLYWLGEIDNPDQRALSAFVKRQTGISSLRFVDHGSAPSVIEALKQWLARAGVEWPTLTDTRQIELANPGFNAGLHDRHRVLQAILNRLADATALTALGYATNRWSWSAHELDAAIAHGGRLLHRSRKAVASPVDAA